MSISSPSGQFFTLADLGLPVGQSDLLALWEAAMVAQYPGYTIVPADPLYNHAQIGSSWASVVAQLCTMGATELFRQYGTQLLGLPYQQGTPAQAIVTISAVDSAGYTLPAGSQLTLTLSNSQVAFQTAADLTIPNASTSGQVTVIAVQSGTSFNGAGSPTQMVSQIDWISSVTLVTPASGGIDQEDDDQYVQRLAQTLTLLAPRPITASDYATMALNFTPAAGTDQQEVGRATSIDGLDPGSKIFTVTAVSGNPSLTVTAAPATGITAAPGSYLLGTDLPSATFTATTASGSPTLSSVSSFTNLAVGAVISGTGIPAGTTITALNPGSNQATMSANATANGTGVTITVATAFILSSTSSSIVMSKNATGSGSSLSATVAGTLGNQREITVCVTDANGNALNADTMAAVDAYLTALREVNFIVNVVAPTYSTIFVTVTVKASSGFVASAVQANVQAALLTYLTPQSFGLPQGTPSGWSNTQAVYLSKLAAVIQGAEGVDHVVAGTLACGLAASPSNTTADVTLPGAFPLPQSTTTSIPLSGITVT